ncbi:hypothetical protein PY365_32605 [Roseiarcaceae bacterium H3SJ34-1]|uniref:hypothetical protein n=1 Tax=Terripilifer ovatus TaxID=3032367 RepID=UPI003AB95BCD|nr:hypothetical protein [Roseiarcaceae bacterium H3SJ34-1]
MGAFWRCFGFPQFPMARKSRFKLRLFTPKKLCCLRRIDAVFLKNGRLGQNMSFTPKILQIQFTGRCQLPGAGVDGAYVEHLPLH